MSISLVRIDDRLIHGQVVEGWIPHIRAERVVVISDEVASDTVQSELMRLALPESIKLDICSVAQAHDTLSRLINEPERTLVLAPGPAEILSLLQMGTNIKSINVGGLHYAAGRIQLGKAIFLNEKDVRDLEAISDFGVSLEGRALPTERVTDILDLIRKKG